jgi:hypothetical protein
VLLLLLLLLLLLQVLSIDRALPLQAHPTTATAKKLHQKDPQVNLVSCGLILDHDFVWSHLLCYFLQRPVMRPPCNVH